MRFLTPIQRFLLLALLYTAVSLWVWDALTDRTRLRPARPDFTLSVEQARQLKTTVPRDAAREATFAIPFTPAGLEQTRQYRCMLLPERDLGRCLVQVIVEGDHHSSYSHMYRCSQLPRSGFAFTIPLSADSSYWKSLGHHAPWSQWDRCGLRRLQIKLFLVEPVAGTAIELRFKNDDESAAPVQLAWARPIAETVALGDRYELTFDLAGWSGNPFNYGELPVAMEVLAPSGQRARVRPFLYQDFEAIPRVDKEVIRPTGAKHFRVRYRPRDAGPHRFRLLARDRDGSERVLREGRFEVTAGRPPAFLKVSQRSPHFFERADGQFVYLTGWNLPYPVDRPYGEEYVPYLPPEPSLTITRKMLDDIADAGGNFIRFWLSDWWNGLEWSKDVDNYGGIGRYNLKHAWLNDQVVRHCEERGIYMQWETLNHVRLKYEYGWPKHPYNAANGGFLRRAADFWAHPETRKWSENRLTYIVARYADSPAVQSWNLMSEPDQVSLRWGVWEQAKALLISQMQFVSRIDPYGHITSSHMCLSDTDIDLFRNEALQFVNSNAYQGLAGLSGNQIEAIRDFANRYEQHGRPMVIAETVGHYAGDPPVKMRRDTLGALWAGIASNLAGTPMSWWWNFNYGEDLGKLYRVAAEFMKNEDLIAEDQPSRGGWMNRSVQVTSLDGNLRALMVGNAGRRFVFAYNFDTLSRTRKIPSRCADNQVRFGEMKPGGYDVEYWDLRAGRTAIRQSLQVGDDGAGVLTPPDFTEGWAIKIVPRGTAAAAPAVTAPDPVAPPPAAAGHGEGSSAADWSWHLQPLVGIVAPAARARSLAEVRLALPAACRGRYPRLVNAGGVPVPCAWEALGNGTGWRLRIPAVHLDDHPLTLTAVTQPPATNLFIQDDLFGLSVVVAPARTSWMNERSQFKRDFDRLSRKKQARMACIDQLENPLGGNEDFLAVYEGPLLAPGDGVYDFASNADDASYVSIDGQEVVSWTSGRGMDIANRPMANLWRNRGQIRLKKGIHWVEYGHRQARGACLARLGWCVPDSGDPRNDLLAQPFPNASASRIDVTPEWAFDGFIPCRVDVEFKGTTLASVQPAFGLELRRPAARMHAVAVDEGNRRAIRFFADEGAQDLGRNGHPIPVWSWNPYWRRFSLEWEQCVDRRSQPMLRTMLYDIDMPLSVTFGGSGPVAKPAACRSWATWAPATGATNLDFVIAAEGVPLVRGRLSNGIPRGLPDGGVP